MSIHMLCDMCDKIIYDDCVSKPTLLKLEIITRYQTSLDKPATYQLHICKGCDLKLAKAILPYLPSVAYYIEPNAGILEGDKHDTGMP